MNQPGWSGSDAVTPSPPGRPAFGWYGSKVRLAPRILSLIASIPHRVYVEPYAGSAAVLFAKPRSPVEIINDIDDQVVNFFRVLRDHPSALARACQLTPYARAEYEADATCHNELSDLEQARRFWVRCCQSFNNGGAGRNVGWAISAAAGSNEARSAAGRALQLEAIATRLSSVHVEHTDALDLVTRYATPDVLIYADPPYLPQTRTGQSRSRQGDYRHDCDVAHHQALAERLRITPAAVLISGYGHSLYEQLYDGWHRIEIKVAKPSGNHSPTAARHATEVLWSNRPAHQATALFQVSTPGPDR